MLPIYIEFKIMSRGQGIGGIEQIFIDGLEIFDFDFSVTVINLVNKPNLIQLYCVLSFEINDINTEGEGTAGELSKDFAGK